MVINPFIFTGEPGVAVPHLPIDPGNVLLTPTTQASAAGQASPRWGGLSQEAAGQRSPGPCRAGTSVAPEHESAAVLGMSSYLD